MILEVKKLNVSYWSANRYINALSDLSFSLKEQEILGVVGESGSGKSTLAYSALKLLPLDAKMSGQIIFKGENIFSSNERILQNIRGEKVGLIFQEPASSFNPVLSIEYQFNELLREKLNLKNKSKIKEIIFDSFKKVRLPEAERIIKSYPHQLSGGQLQRIAIAMAISLKPQILIADEPTSSLDVTIESQILHLFEELREELNLTIIFITHNLDLVKELCDRVLVLCDGRMRELAKREELFKNPKDEYTKKLLTSLEELEA